MLLLNSFWLQSLHFKKEPYHYLRFEKNSHYYELRLGKDLLEDWTLVTSNGRIKSKSGQSHTQVFTTFDEALTHFYFAVDMRHQKNYCIRRYLVEDLIYLFLLMTLVSQKESTLFKSKKLSAMKSNIKFKKLIIPHSDQICFAF